MSTSVRIVKLFGKTYKKHVNILQTQMCLYIFIPFRVSSQLFVALTDECSHFRLQVAGEPNAVGVLWKQGKISVIPWVAAHQVPHTSQTPPQHFTITLTYLHQHTFSPHTLPFLSSVFNVYALLRPVQSLCVRICHRSKPRLDHQRRSQKPSELLTAGQNPISVSIWPYSGAMFLLLLMI